jgi:transposase
MVNQIQKKVVRHLKMGQLNKIIKKKKKELEIIDRLIFIRFLYKGKTVDETCDFMDISLSTGHRWLDRWNEEGCDGLFNRYSNGGRKSKLTENQFKLLDEMMQKDDYLTTKKMYQMIKDDFKVEYSLKRVREIAHKLGYSYKKGYMIYSKMHADAEDTLKKTSKIQNR